ncbi:WecB/TagA/CpsF family glycosyltransferase [uncultured Brevundimonas sp.]|uniref:WecB/TagA/CpsF family glycosyltransferase n=1 Tax=uncultured Brevundimonas sp. TaxID=213418 RepID=UPI0030EB9B69|tara:strand:+ start:1341 stop:2207 length:867 start_codon:yes stop_codon:yes gene_type:complete
MFHERTGFDLAAALPDRRRLARTLFRTQRRPEERATLLGEVVDLVRPEEVLLHVERWVRAGRKAIVANHNLHSLYLVRRDPSLRRFFQRADLVQLDSTPLVWFGRLIGLSSRPFHRCTYLDWRNHFWSLANREGWRVMYVGGAPGVAERAARRLSSDTPGATIAVLDGYFDVTAGSSDNAEVLAAVNEFQPNVLFVGMGMPRQEAWIADNIEALPQTVILSVGAAFDYEAGEQKAAPRWMGRIGLEWLFRLVVDPKRLFTRYCVEPWSLLGPALADLRAARRLGARES